MVKHRIGGFGFSEEFVRYGLIAASAFVIDLAVARALYQAGLFYTPAVALGYLVGTGWNYVLSTRWVFAYRRLAGSFREPLIFWLIAASGLVLTILFMNLFRSLGAPFVAAKFFSEGSIFVVTFGLKKILLFMDLLPLSLILKWYRHANFLDKVHVLVRRATLPLGRLLQKLPAGSQKILEIGSGHGLVLLSLIGQAPTPPRQAMGSDIDERKNATAREAAKVAGLPVTFASGQAPLRQKWDLILVVDVLYLLPSRQQEQLVRQAVGALAPGGTLAIKEMAHRPRWKFWLTWLQENISVRLLRITASPHRGRFSFPHLDTFASDLTSQELRSRLIRLDKGLIYPHQLLIIKKNK